MWGRWKRKRARPEGIRITKVGLWYVLLILLTAVASTNTGNNALYMVLSLMLGVLIVSGVVSRHNLQSLSVAVQSPSEVFAGRPFSLRVDVESRGRILPRWLVIVGLSVKSRPLLIPYLPPGTTSRGFLDLLLPRRGRVELGPVHAASLFPLGLFRKGMRYPAQVDLLVYPEIFQAGSYRQDHAPEGGDDPSRRRGRGHDLHALRSFQPGDDPRGIHWKQSARTQNLIFTERGSEAGRRLAIVLDNAVGEPQDEPSRKRFEHLVSEAATAAVDHLDRGYQVELITRQGRSGFGAGRPHRRSILETLALIDSLPLTEEPLGDDLAGPNVLHLGLEPKTEAVS